MKMILVRYDGEQVLKYPYTLGDARREYPHVSFHDAVTSEDLQPFGIAVVHATDLPASNGCDVPFETDPVFDGSAWRQAWRLRPASHTETRSAKMSARQRRDDLLAASDWTQLPDVRMDDMERGAWRKYRQILRDITRQPGFPWDLAWPERPQ